VGVMSCVECGERVNTEWTVCPNCGADPVSGLSAEQRQAARDAAEELTQREDPLERARAAKRSGLEFLEIALPWGGPRVGVISWRRESLESADARASLLAAIEAEGWTLVSSAYAFEDSRFEQELGLMTPLHGVVEGRLVGVYLFRARGVDSPQDDASDPGAALGY
jgi:hypothetical protein